MFSWHISLLVKRPCLSRYCSLCPKQEPFQSSENNGPAGKDFHRGISTPCFLVSDPVVLAARGPYHFLTRGSTSSVFTSSLHLRVVTTQSYVANHRTGEKIHVALVGYQTVACFTVRVSTASVGWYPFFIRGPLADIGTPSHIYCPNATNYININVYTHISICIPTDILY